MEDSYGRLHMNIDVREIKQVVNILHMTPLQITNWHSSLVMAPLLNHLLNQDLFLTTVWGVSPPDTM